MNSMNLPRNIQAIRLSHHLSQKEMARLLGTSQTVISFWETGKYSPELDGYFEKIKAVFQVTDRDLLGYSDGFAAKFYGLESLRASSAGEQDAPTYLSDKYGDGFLTTISDDSMDKIFLPGSSIYFSTSAEVSNGDIVALKLDGSTLIRRLRQYDDITILEPVSNNKAYVRQIIDEANPDSPQINLLGKAVWFCSEL